MFLHATQGSETKVVRKQKSLTKSKDTERLMKEQVTEKVSLHLPCQKISRHIILFLYIPVEDTAFALGLIWENSNCALNRNCVLKIKYKN